jgi:HAD superfamily hydrolase (TIGR01549 family)
LDINLISQKYLKSNIFYQVDPYINYSKTKVVIFDVDGTLYNQLKLRLYMFKHIFFYLLINPTKINEIRIIHEFRRQREIHSGEQLESVETAQYLWAAERCNVDPDMVKELVNKWIYETPLRYLKKCRKSGVKKLFKKIQENDIKIAIFSDYPSINKMNSLNLKADLIVSSTDPEIDVFKPNPKGLRYIVKALHCSISDAIFIGDRQDKDGECALNAGMPCVILPKFKLSSCVLLKNCKDKK